MKPKIPNELIATAKRLAKKERGLLESLKRERKQVKRDDFIWHSLLTSFATMGRTTGWFGLIGNKDNYNKLDFDLLTSMSPKKRLTHIKSVCRMAKIRMPDIKAKYIFECHQQIIEWGGLMKTKMDLLRTVGRDRKINFLKRFIGIGDKYARNIMMAVYHKDFRNSIAIDSRIKDISKSWNLTFSNYQAHEDFYLELAKKANLNGWEFDKLMYNFKSEFLKK
jgi:hypothetical protein